MKLYQEQLGSNVAVDPSIKCADELPSGLVDSYDKLAEIFGKQFRGDLASRRRVGEIIEETFAKQKQCPISLRRATYGKQIINSLAKALCIHPRILYSCREFANTISREECGQISKLPVSWSHVLKVLGIRNREKRLQWLTRAAHEHWTADELNRAMTAEYFPELANQVPEPRQRSLPVELGRCLKVAQRYRGLQETILREEGYDSLLQRARNTPPNSFTAEHRNQAAAVLAALETVQTDSAEAVRVARSVVAHIELCVAAAAQQAAQHRENPDDEDYRPSGHRQRRRMAK